MQKRKAKVEVMFKILVNNAIDFLERSIDELEFKPKYSVINFCSGIEILFKARLLLEHWSLVVDDPGKAKYDQFQSGEFKSVTMEEAIHRLQNIIGESLTPDEQKCFEQLRNHRNKLVHFYHSEYGAKANKKAREEIVIEQYRAWYYIYRLINQKWKLQFQDYLPLLESLNMKLNQRKSYLKVKYEELNNPLSILQKRGIGIAPCNTCGFEAGQEQVIFEPLITVQCLVCENIATTIKMACPDCGGTIYSYEGEKAECKSCHKSFDLNRLVQMLTEKYGSHLKPKDAITYPKEAYCAKCEYSQQESVIYIEHENKWLCIACLAVHENAGACEWCNDLIAGEDLVDSYLYGCILCDGKLPSLLNDD